MADPDRLRIVNLLRLGPKSVGEISESLDSELVNVSHHLGVLRTNHIVLVEKQGRHRVYRLNPELIPDAKLSLLDFGCCRLEMDKAWKPVDPHRAE